MKKIFVLLTIYCSIITLNAATYYVSSSATGSGNGTLNNPYTVNQANNIVVAGDKVIVASGNYNFNSDFSFSGGSYSGGYVVWLAADMNNKPNFYATHNLSVTAFTMSKYLELNGINFYGQTSATRTVIAPNDYCSLKNGSSIYRAGGSSTGNDNIRANNIRDFLMQNWLVQASAWNGINLQITQEAGLRNLVFDGVEITGCTHHNSFNFFPATTGSYQGFIDSIVIKNSYVHDNNGSILLSRHIRMFSIYNNIFEDEDIGLASGDNTPADTFDVSYPDRRSLIVYNTFIGDGGKPAINNWVANGLEIKNNAFYGEFQSEWYYRFQLNYESNWTSGVNPGAPLNNHDIDYNLYYQTAIDNEYWYFSSNRSWSAWQGQGYDTHGINPVSGSSPAIFVNAVNDDYSPVGGGLLVGAGTPIDFITVDRFGNPRDPNNPTIGAIEYNTGVGDIFSPSLLSAVINNATTVTLNFSEPLNSTTAQNVNNYSINNGISVTGTFASGSQVVLNTSEHPAGNYLVTVNNVTDLAGNVINPNNNTAAYNYVEPDLTAPILQGVVVNSSTSLTANFSEALTPTTAQNINNFSINNGINVTTASISGSQVILTTTSHVNGSYTLTVNNVTDLAGNIINPVGNTANYEYSIVDLTAPQVVSAAIIDSVTLNVYFSENLESSGAVNISNYAINNISITNATLSSNVVTLTTSIHPYGTYSVIVNNITDLAGNVIDPQQNSAIYEYQEDPNSGLLMFPVSNVLESVVPEPLHNGEKTIDGNGFYQGDPESRWSGDTMPEWLVYDLGDVQILNMTKLSFYKWNEGRTYNYTLQVSTDSINWTTVRANALSVTEEWSEEVVGPIDARYIKVIFISSNQNTWAGLWECEFWGHLKTPTNIEDEDATPTTFVLEQNYPNPFNPSTMIQVHIPKNTHVRLAVYNMLGEFITELANAEYSSGTYEFNFEAKELASGIYIYRVESQDFIDSKKMILLR